MNTTKRIQIACLVATAAMFGGCNTGPQPYGAVVKTIVRGEPDDSSWTRFTNLADRSEKGEHQMTLKDIGTAVFDELVARGFEHDPENYEFGYIVGFRTGDDQGVHPGSAVWNPYSGWIYVPATTYEVDSREIRIMVYARNDLRKLGEDAMPVWEGTIRAEDIRSAPDVGRLAPLFVGELLANFPSRVAEEYSIELHRDSAKDLEIRGLPLASANQ